MELDDWTTRGKAHSAFFDFIRVQWRSNGKCLTFLQLDGHVIPPESKLFKNFEKEMGDYYLDNDE